MEPLTTGSEYFKDARVGFEYKSDDLLSSLDPMRGHFSVVFASEGTGVFQVGEERIPFSTPVVPVLNEKDPLRLVHSIDMSDQSIFFHPSVVNDSLEISHIHDRNSTPSSGAGTLHWAPCVSLR